MKKQLTARELRLIAWARSLNDEQRAALAVRLLRHEAARRRKKSV